MICQNREGQDSSLQIDISWDICNLVPLYNISWRREVLWDASYSMLEQNVVTEGSSYSISDVVPYSNYSIAVSFEYREMVVSSQCQALTPEIGKL